MLFCFLQVCQKYYINPLECHANYYNLSTDRIIIKYRESAEYRI
jgi:hypothetical protein